MPRQYPTQFDIVFPIAPAIPLQAVKDCVERFREAGWTSAHYTTGPDGARVVICREAMEPATAGGIMQAAYIDFHNFFIP